MSILSILSLLLSPTEVVFISLFTHNIKEILQCFLAPLYFDFHLYILMCELTAKFDYFRKYDTKYKIIYVSVASIEANLSRSFVSCLAKATP